MTASQHVCANPPGAATPPSRQAYVVLGSPEGGVQAVSTLLSLSGSAAPDAGAAESLASLNADILEAFDSGWDDVFGFRPRPHLSNFETVYFGRACDLLSGAAGQETILLSDPNTSLLVRLWTRALKNGSVRPTFVVVVRHPLDVAEALRRAHGFSLERSILIWASHLVAAERDTRGQPRLFVDYQQVSSDWRGVLRRIEETSGRPLPRTTPAASADIDRAFGALFDGSRGRGQAELEGSSAPEWFATLYRLLTAAVEGEDPSPEAMAAIQRRLEELEAAIGPVLAELRTEARAGSQSRVEALATDAAKATREIARLEDEVEQGRRSVGRAETLKTQLIAAAEALEASERRFDVTARELETAQRAYQDVERAAAELESDIDRCIRDAERAFYKEELKRSARGAELERRVEELELQVHAARGARDDAEARAAAVEAEAQRTKDMLDAVRGSSTWRLTAPVRGMVARLLGRV